MHRDEVARLRAVRAAHLLLDDNLQLLLGLAGGGGAAGAGAGKRTDAHHTCKNGSDLHFPVARASANGGAACKDSGEEEEGDVSCGTSKTEKTGLLTGSPHNAKKSCSEASCGHESKLSPCLLHTQDKTTQQQHRRALLWPRQPLQTVQDMSATERLSNDAILGLDLDADFALDPTTSAIVQPNPAATAATSTTAAAKRRSDKLTADILLSGRGIPKLLDTFRKFKFAKRPKSDVLSTRKGLHHSNTTRYGDDHHYKNLQRILATYQAFGHTLSPHLKFDRFIANLARGVDDAYTKAWIRDQVREEMRAKMERQTAIEAGTEAAKPAAAAADARNEIQGENGNGDVEEEEEEEEQWPELFGGETQHSTSAADANDSSIDISQIRQTPMFSTFLRTSSQPVPSEEDLDMEMETGGTTAVSAGGRAGISAGDMDAFDALDAAETGLEDLLRDNDDDNDAENDSAPPPGQFSQYLAQDLSSQPEDPSNHPSQPQTQTQAPVPSSTTSLFSDDDFSDNDDDDAALRL